MQNYLQNYKPQSRKAWLVIAAFAVLLVTAAAVATASGGISEKKRALVCAETMQALNGATGAVIAMSFSGKSEAELDEYLQGLLDAVARKHGLEPEQINGICEEQK